MTLFVVPIHELIGMIVTIPAAVVQLVPSDRWTLCNVFRFAFVQPIAAIFHQNHRSL